MIFKKVKIHITCQTAGIISQAIFDKYIEYGSMRPVGKTDSSAAFNYHLYAQILFGIYMRLDRRKAQLFGKNAMHAHAFTLNNIEAISVYQSFRNSNTDYSTYMAALMSDICNTIHQQLT